MDLREMLVVMRPDTPTDAILAVAGRLADEYRGFVRGLCIFASPPPTMAECYVIGTAAVDEVVDHLGVEVAALIAPVHARFRATLDACGAAGDWATLQGFEASEAPLRARLVDLVILPRPHEHDGDALHIAESFLVEGGAPCLLVPAEPAEPKGFGRIVLAWNGTREAKRALDEAIPLLRRADAVDIVIVGDPAQTHIHDRSDAPALHLARHGIVAETTHVPETGSTAEAILARCHSFGADLLVIGAYGHKRLTEAVLGGVTRSILLHAPLPVLMAH